MREEVSKRENAHVKTSCSYEREAGRELQGKSSDPIGSVRGHGEPTRDRARVTDIGLQRAASSEGDESKHVTGSDVPAACFTLISCLTYSLTLGMEVIYLSETSVSFKQTTWLYSSEDGTLQKKLIIVRRVNPR
jgi:hypothetical protein